MKTCSKHGRKFCWQCFWITASFPIEHVLWEKAPILSAITRWAGL